MYVDVNGSAGPNILGYDIFTFAIHRGVDAIFMMQEIDVDKTVFAAEKAKYVANPDALFPYCQTPREYLLEQCKSTYRACGALIKQNGWKIPKDYPWK